MKMALRVALAAWLITGVASAAIPVKVKGFSLTEIGEHRYDAYEAGGVKTEAQLVVDRLFDTGVRHIVLSPRATMSDPRQSFVVPMTSELEAPAERDRYLRLISYLHGKGMTVGIRPIFFVIDSFGNIPYVEALPGGGTKVWWHGNIQPWDPAAWFNSFAAYHARYAEIARTGNVEEYTIGAELQSLTVGLGQEWPQYPLGFPSRWSALLAYVRPLLSASTRVMYDINYTDEEVDVGAGVMEAGGEFIAWRERLFRPTSAENAALVLLWNSLDGIGIDMYRSLALRNDVLPTDYAALVAFLRRGTDTFALQLKRSFDNIALATGKSQDLVLKELGYRSVERGFVDPFEYAGSGDVNTLHQAAAYEAVLASFSMPGWDQFRGAVFWDASVDMDRHGPFDPGFSPIGKEATENVLRRFFGGSF